MPYVTIDEVASRAGVSPTTVSHVFSGKRYVAPATQDLVRKVADELGYSANAVAKSLRMSRTNTAMIVIPDITNPYYPAFARGVQDALRPGGYQTLFCNTDSREDEERRFLDEARARRLDGLAFMGYWVTPEELSPLAKAGICVVNLGEGTEEIDSVHSLDRLESQRITEYLLQSYGPRIAFIDGVAGAPVSRSRHTGYVSAFEASGLEVPHGYVVEEDFTREGGRRGMRHLLGLQDPPRGVFCANDLIALGALDELAAAGRRVPGDVAVAGFDDIEIAGLVSPPLTTVHNPAEAVGALCGELLRTRMDGSYSGTGRHETIGLKMVLRESA